MNCTADPYAYGAIITNQRIDNMCERIGIVGLSLSAPTLSDVHKAWMRSLDAGLGDRDVAALISRAYDET